MSDFDDETRTTLNRATAEQQGAATVYDGQVHPAWNIGDNPNGGYLLALTLAAVRQATPTHVDPLSVTVHYLRPGLPGQPCRIDVQVLRSGRTLSTVRATLVQAGTARLEVLAALGDLGDLEHAAEPVLTLPMPPMPPPEQCRSRSGDAQGVGLPILSRLDIRLHPEQALAGVRADSDADADADATAGARADADVSERPGSAGRAEISGWIRFHDGREPDALACLLFADAFPPALFGLLGAVGWVPTVELTVHVRRRPAPGWMLGQFKAHDLSDGRVIEDGALWDAQGRLVAQSRQLALVRSPAAGG
jgi:acyl-CoA thioesterase